MQQNHKLNHASDHLVQTLKGKVWLYEVNWPQKVIFFFYGVSQHGHCEVWCSCGHGFLPEPLHLGISSRALESFPHGQVIMLFRCRSDQIRSVVQLCPTLWDPMNRSTPDLPVHHQLPEFTQTHVYRVSDAIQPSHPLSSPSPPAPNPSQHQSLFQWVNSSHEVAKVLESQL